MSIITSDLVAADPNGPIRRVLIVGVSGYLGSALAHGLRDDFEVIGTYNTHPVRIDGVTSFKMNCTNGGEILDLLNKQRPEAVIYCAGLSDEIVAQENPALAESLHFKAAAVFFKILPMVLRFIYFSPDDSLGAPYAEQEAYDETVAALPQTALAKTRHQGETACLNAKRYTAVFRLGEVFGEPFGWNINSLAQGAVDRNYRPHWFDRLHDSLARGRPMTLSTSVIKSYLYVGDFVRAIRLYLNQAPVDAVLYNLAGRTPISQLEFGRLMCKKLGYNPALVRSGASLPIKVPLNPQKFEKEFSFEFQNVDEALDEYAERLRTGFTKGWV